MGAKAESKNNGDSTNENISLTFGHEGFYWITTNNIIGKEKIENYIV